MFSQKHQDFIRDSIATKAAEMMQVYYGRVRKPRDTAQWQNRFKEQAMQLMWECHFKQIPPPLDLVFLTACLFGKKHSWSYAKFAVLNFLAKQYPPTKEVKDLPRGTKTKVHRIIEECDGVQMQGRKLDKAGGNEARDYRRTLEGWLKEELFFMVWEAKYAHFQKNSPRPNENELLEVVKKAIDTMK
ncbi:MAG: hypothetical protein HND56_07955 [Pseudomonadota bacterium]|nr:hypothetical protein [Pseudomonadota bacterium]QKK05623.1 MAG: hypothetical protein HND56_07955 [Pseudomonadota bacterium]